MFDVYKASSLKVEARSKMGKGIRRRVTSTRKTPQNWKSFLRDNNNKTKRFHFLADRLSEGDMPSLVTVTKEEDICCNRVIALYDLGPCTHEEADPSIFVHARHEFTGWDTVSAFRGKGKKSAWQTWNVCKEISTTFTKLSQYVTALDNADHQSLEKFVVVMYDRSTSVDTIVNDARLNLSARKQRLYDAIPPT